MSPTSPSNSRHQKQSSSQAAQSLFIGYCAMGAALVSGVVCLPHLAPMVAAVTHNFRSHRIPGSRDGSLRMADAAMGARALLQRGSATRGYAPSARGPRCAFSRGTKSSSVRPRGAALSDHALICGQ
jgi:hypothetical protein